GRRGAVACGLLGVLLAVLLVGPQPERPPHTDAANLTDFVAQLRQRGVRLHAVWGARDGVSGHHVYLTEDPSATWLALQSKVPAVRQLHQWRGTVCVEHVLPEALADDALALCGTNGPRIGKFLLFRDDRLL